MKARLIMLSVSCAMIAYSVAGYASLFGRSKVFGTTISWFDGR